MSEHEEKLIITRCSGWHEEAHQTHLPTTPILLKRGFRQLCLVCLIDCYNDMTLTEEERNDAKALFDTLYILISQGDFV